VVIGEPTWDLFIEYSTLDINVCQKKYIKIRAAFPELLFYFQEK